MATKVAQCLQISSRLVARLIAASAARDGKVRQKCEIQFELRDGTTSAGIHKKPNRNRCSSQIIEICPVSAEAVSSPDVSMLTLCLELPT